MNFFVVPLGIITGCYFILQAIGFETGMKMFFHVPSLLIVVGGTVGSVFIHFPGKQLSHFLKRIMVVFSSRSPNYISDIQLMLNWALLYRKDGPQALNPIIPKIKDHFLKHGLQLLADQVPADQILVILEKDMEYINKRHEQGISFFQNLAAYCPAYGLIGTLIGLIIMLRELDNVDSLGQNMSIALITTFYGTLLANLVFLPIAGHLEIIHNEEMVQKQMFIEGIIGIANEESNYIISEKMSMCLTQKEREKVKKKSVKVKQNGKQK